MTSAGPKYTANKTKQCDECPFKTSYEKAGLPYSTWLGADRILDGDPFFVRIIP